MKKTLKLKESVENASESNYEEFNNQIAKLIEDEQEAIQGYKQDIDILSNSMTDYQNSEIFRTMSHIIDEEKEHIEELNKLKEDIDITSWK